MAEGARDDEREALARIINDSHLMTRGWAEMRAKSGFERTNGDDYSISQGLAAADALIAAGYRKHPEPEITEYRNVLSDGEVVITPNRSRFTVAKRRAAGLWVPVGEGEQSDV